MQHHGAPTRLLDFTYSPYVASYFALENTRSDCAVWAVMLSRCQDGAVSLFKTTGSGRDTDIVGLHMYFAELLNRLYRTPVDCVFPVEPFLRATRPAAQRGLLLCPGNVTKNFMDNLVSLQTAVKPYPLIKFVLPCEIREEGLNDLGSQGIDREILFPDLDGLGKALNLKLELTHDFTSAYPELTTHRDDFLERLLNHM